jgi:hypothetical protein
MSYARWSNSNWYAFDNCSGLFSLWHCELGDTPNFCYEGLRDHRDSGTLESLLQASFPGVGYDDVQEAINIIGLALEEAV